MKHVLTLVLDYGNRTRRIMTFLDVSLLITVSIFSLAACSGSDRDHPEGSKIL